MPGRDNPRRRRRLWFLPLGVRVTARPAEGRTVITASGGGAMVGRSGGGELRR